MSPFVVFIIILVVIWTLSGIATAINKQKEQERRRQIRMQMERAAAAERASGGTPPPLPPAMPPRQISGGLAARFPDVLLPPDLPRPAQPPPARPTGPRPGKTAKRAKKVDRRPTPVLPVSTDGGEEPVANLVAPAPPIAPVRQALTGAQAPAISRWLKPETLRQQFILTEIFQPPLALRDNSNR